MVVNFGKIYKGYLDFIVKMTVISAMKFNESEGAIISDEQSSTDSRKYDNSEKLYDFSHENMTFAVGGTGALWVLYDIAKKFGRYFEDYSKNESKQNIEKNGVDYLVDIFSSLMLNEKRTRFDSHLKFKFGLSEKDFIRGYTREEDGSQNQISELLMRNYHEYLTNGVSHISNNHFIGIGKDKNEIGIYYLGMEEKPFSSSNQYLTAGSGQDSADIELSSFFDKKTREERKNIDPVDGLVALISSTETASKKNVGVGGLPHMKILKNNSIITPSENNSKLSTEIIKASQEGYVSKDFQNESIYNLLFDNGNFENIEDEFMKQSHNLQAMNRMLRGYHKSSEMYL
tara:strand:- start:67 stop:1098 length:1032 start_codon:yes stop_codon:yes gene_type:complete